MNKRFAIKLIAACAIAAGSTAGFAQDVIKIANIVELSGGGASAGTNFKNGVELAVKEVNATGGILGKKIQTTTADTQSNPGVAKGLTQKAIDNDVFAIFGPVFSGSIMVSMAESRRAEVPNFTGGEAAAITEQGNPYVFRTSFTQATAMPKVALHQRPGQAQKYCHHLCEQRLRQRRSGRDQKALANSTTKVLSEISTEPGQVDFSASVLRAKQSNADGVFVYSNEEESARLLRELRKQGWSKPIIGETTLTGQKVIELAGEAANGAIAHVGLTVDAPVPAIRAFKAKFEKEYKYVSDHNGMKGYSGIYMLKAAIEKAGKLDLQSRGRGHEGLEGQRRQIPRCADVHRV
ncbi:ABC transporter substrate-binding protein [Polaromonas sp. P1-6]|nr:ABC transporter substrate-binding protein [Polaromonas sp. P1-6]UUZ67601.1 ABC transporter substrate-binding protein [Polaromonas sp. P2-4]